VLALGGLATPNNVYIDLSGRIMFANHPKIIAETLRTWLEKPALWNKLLYGSDIIWGERYLHTCARTGRDAIYLALASMIDDKIIDEPLAVTLARKILRENALGLYRFTEGVHLKNA
jgi:predicted TIM-barrel fold metal-dependent hydrolase